ncbi:hypothetical protein DSECCO2_359960 [anaerobic digester metagenome]
MKCKYDFKEIFKLVDKIALASSDQVLAGRNPKAPSINWYEHPSDYKGFMDNNYGTGIICDYIQAIDKYLVVIDLDTSKEPEHIPIKVLKECMQFAMNDTYSVRTQSGGYHIYLLSKEKPEAKQPNCNIDYQTNTGTGKGKYIISDYIYDKNGNKLHYTKLEESPDTITVVRNTDEVLNELLTNLEDKGYAVTPATEYTKQISDIIKRNLRKGTRNDLIFSVIGYLRLNNFTYEVTTQIVRMACKDDEQLTERLKVVDRTYQQEINNLKGYSGLKDHLNGTDLRELETLVVGDGKTLENKIRQLLAKQKEPSPKLLADYINSELILYKDPKVLKYYERHKKGTITEIDSIRIEEYMNSVFGANQISSTRCKNILKYITKHIERDYNILLFDNGFYNTETREFNPNKEELNEIPKLSLQFSWNPDAEGGKIKKLIDQILLNPKYPYNQETWLKAVGHAFISGNRIGKMVIVQGEAGTGKSTLSNILKRMFTDNFSEIPTQTIVKNERFTLYPLLGKSINIDDDISNGMLTSIGKLNSIITGNGLEIEVKGENKSIQAQAEHTPKLFSNGNTLPPVIGTGFQRRLLLVHADNQVSYEQKDEGLQHDILSGKYDKDIEWLIYTAINLYLDNQDTPIINKTDEKVMKQEYDLKAYPLKHGIQEIFEESYEPNDFIEKREVHKLIKRWCKDAYKKGLISSEHKAPGIHGINKAMDRAGFNITRKTINGERQYIYEDIILKPYWKQILDPTPSQQDQTVLAES